MKRYWKVAHCADTTETGCPMLMSFIETTWVGFSGQRICEHEMMEDWLYEKYGPQVDYVQGVAPCLSWRVFESTKEEFEKAPNITRWGSNPVGKRFYLRLGGKQDKIEEVLPPPNICSECGKEVDS